MINIDDAKMMLDGIADELPEDFYKSLNGGIILSPETKLHPASDDVRPLFILGEYHYERLGLGRYIIIYFGSFTRTFGGLTPERMREKLRNTLLHEFTHHLESLAGERGLAAKDARELAEYRRKLEE